MVGEGVFQSLLRAAREGVIPSPPPVDTPRDEPQAWEGEPLALAPIRLPPERCRYTEKGVVGLGEAREMVWDAMMEYLETPHPDHILLINAPPGTGKTVAAVRLAAKAAGRGRVGFAVQNHRAVETLHDIAVAFGVDWGRWYEWQPRRDKEGENGEPVTCPKASLMDAWLSRGGESYQVCIGLCGRETFRGRLCYYLAQRNREARVWVIQHAHTALSHPLMETFSLLIGDENPIGAFLRRWVIPARFIIPKTMGKSQPDLLRLLLATKQVIQSPLPRGRAFSELVAEAMRGTVRDVADIAGGFRFPANASLALETPHTPEDITNADYFYLPTYLSLLAREARRIARGGRAISRIWAENLPHGGRGLALYIRHSPPSTLPEHIVWLDATGNPRVYEALFHRKVKVAHPRVRMRGRIYQVVNRLNNASAVYRTERVDGGEDESDNGERETVMLRRAGRQMLDLVEHIAREKKLSDFGVVTFKSVLPQLPPDWPALHFYAARGSNALGGKPVFILGTPQPPLEHVLRTAAQLYSGRDEPFNATWSRRVRPYRLSDNFLHEAGGWGYPVSGYWGDPDLQAVLEMYREEELLHAVHRARLLSHDVDVYLLSNLPLPGLPVHLVWMHDLLTSPDGVNRWKWARLLHFVEGREVITVRMVTEALGVSRTTARRYLLKLVETGEWEIESVGRRGRGRQTTVRRTGYGENGSVE